MRGLHAEHFEMRERIGVDDDDHKGRQSKKGEERQFDIEEGQFDCAFQQKIFVGDGASRNRDVGENEEIGEPQAAADGGRVFDRFFNLLEIVGLRALLPPLEGRNAVSSRLSFRSLMGSIIA
jgi:hypothetical protein